MTERDIRDYLQDILNHINLAEQFITGMTFEQFQTDDKTIFAVTRALEVIGEASKQIPLSLRENYAQIPWKGVTGMRDKLIHAYFGVKVDVLWDTTQQDLPRLKPVIQAMLRDLSSTPDPQ
ncbi:MAG: DUF86 domain-containing protein [Leptolyngbya sp. SIO4C5]|uniref:HepT-like ribonuclease domain-containing protein n=1 Tax=Sphaerothrix gracilis TaxID=3151835 RepID=UPI0013C04502|nr:DUF86 domain-containing protein [Leptolyngbya sp. SIO4C5]